MSGWIQAAMQQNTITATFSGACYYLSSTINPFLYSLLSVRFRRGFQDVLRRCSGRMPVGIGLVQGTIQDFFPSWP